MTTVSTSKNGLEFGHADLKTTGPITFGPDGILFVADNAAARIYALDVRDDGKAAGVHPLEVENLDGRLAAYLGCSPEDVYVRDMAVHPVSQNVYLSVMRGTGSSAMPVIVRIAGDGGMSHVALDGIAFSYADIDAAPAQDDSRQDTRLVQGTREGQEVEPRPGFKLRIAREGLRSVTITDMAFIDGSLIVAGASNEEFSSTLRRIPFPFGGASARSSLEIFHVSHGKYETASPIRTFLPFDGGRSVLASYTCTPVVQFSLADLQAGAHVKGKTVAELGAGNTPLDMVSYKRDGEEYLLVSNARHPLMKIKGSDIPGQQGLTEPQEPLGVPRETLPHEGVGQMANLNGSYVLMLQQDGAGNLSLHSYANASL
ncbi:MAG TPA: hypothetical protein VH951_04400 [Dehalococcoidia bacterium]|jgi:hypothetical protein